MAEDEETPRYRPVVFEFQAWVIIPTDTLEKIDTIGSKKA